MQEVSGRQSDVFWGGHWPLTHRAGLVHLAIGQVVDEGDVVAWVPVERVEDGVELHRVQQPVDGLHHVQAVLLRRALADVERAADEVVLHVHDEEHGHRPDNLKQTQRNCIILTKAEETLKNKFFEIRCQIKRHGKIGKISSFQQ